MNPHMQPGPPSPWQGSEHVELHGWELDDATSLLDAAATMRAMADELTAAHDAGWWLESPMYDGRVHARRPSRRQRTRTRTADQADQANATQDSAPPDLTVRVRIVDEPSRPEWPTLDFDAARSTPWLAVRQGAIAHVAGPPPDDAKLSIIAGQVTADELEHRRWALVAARVGPGVDLVAEGGALRAHTVSDGVVVRTIETLVFKHAADRSTTLPVAAAAYRRLARAAEAMDDAGGRLSSIDDGFLVVEYAQ